MTKSPSGKFIKCMFCAQEFYIPINRFNTAKFCSRKCSAKHARVQIKQPCIICGTIFEHISSRSNKAKYCSRSCYYKSNIGKGSVEHECQHCHKKFMDSPCKKRKFCSRICVNKSSKEVFKPRFSTVRKSMIRRGMVNKCEQCGYDEFPEILGIHHKDQNKTNNTPENLVVLCPMCHSLAHKKHICH